ncbi:MAG: hypothetical protein K2G44_03270 [Clostridia bacterium]|nr:hypothetical protein [Clostridia bacterium]
MKGRNKWFCLLVAIVTLVFTVAGMTACGDTGKDLSAYAGTYKVESIRRSQGINDKTYQVGDSLKPALSTLPNEFGADTLTDDYLVIELKADGTATVNSKISESLGGFTGTKTGEWTIDKQDFIELKALTDNMTSLSESSLRFNDEGKLRFWCKLGEMNYVEYCLAK